MSKIINIKLDVTKLNKDKFFVGKKGTYANITVAENMNGENEYGDTHYVYESQSKDERLDKTEKNYVGNGKEFVFEGTDNSKATTHNSELVTDDDLPF